MTAALLEPTPEEIRALNSTLKCSARASDFEDFEQVLRDPARSPLTRMQVERQQRNDCQGNATANGEEYRSWYCSGFRQMPQLSEIYAYNASEYRMSAGQVGKDQGTSIHSGVRVLVEGIPALGVAPGLPTESAWPYAQYYRSQRQFEAAAKAVEIQPGHVTEHGPLPDFRGMLAAVTAGGSGHIGTKWGVDWQDVGGPKRCMDRMPRSGGGHATEIIWAVEVRGQWYLCVWNSHGDGYYLMSQRCYEELQAKEWKPFGGFLLMPDKAIQRYHDCRETGGGLW